MGRGYDSGAGVRPGFLDEPPFRPIGVKRSCGKPLCPGKDRQAGSVRILDAVPGNCHSLPVPSAELDQHRRDVVMHGFMLNPSRAVRARYDSAVSSAANATV